MIVAAAGDGREGRPVSTVFNALVDEYSAPYWDGLDEGRVMLRRCDECGYVRPPAVFRTKQPAPWVCPNCLATGAEWVEATGEATVETFVWYMSDRAGSNPEYAPFKLPLPYNVSLVRFAEGPRMITNVVGVDFGELAVGQRVGAVFAKVGGRTILRFSRV